MTRIDFHVNVTDKLAFACRLARKARAAGSLLVFYSSDAAVLSALDRNLWTFSALDFLPHVLATDPLAAVTPILLVDASQGESPVLAHHDVLVNLDRTQPAFFSRFERLIDVVEANEEDRVAGRARWQFYKDRGYALTRHDLAKAAQ